MKILANLAIAVNESYKVAQITIIQSIYGGGILICNPIIIDNNILFDVNKQFETIFKLFGIEIQ